MKRAFSLVEIMIVAALLGILAAIVLPLVNDHISEAKGATAKENLRLLRQQIELNVTHNMDKGGLTKIPDNPFNDLNTIQTIPMGSPPAEATGEFGWIYHIPTKTIRLDWPGTDKENVPYYDY